MFLLYAQGSVFIMPSILWSSEEIKKRINLYLFMDKNKGIPSLMDKLMDKLEIHSKHKSRMNDFTERKEAKKQKSPKS